MIDDGRVWCNAHTRSARYLCPLHEAAYFPPMLSAFLCLFLSFSTASLNKSPVWNNAALSGQVLLRDLPSPSLSSFLFFFSLSSFLFFLSLSLRSPPSYHSHYRSFFISRTLTSSLTQTSLFAISFSLMWVHLLPLFFIP